MSHELRHDQTDIWVGEVMTENAQSVLRHVLESSFPKEHFKGLSSSSVDEHNLRKIQDAYGAYMNETQIKEQGIQPLLDMLSQVEELYPPHPGHSFQQTPNHTRKGLLDNSANGLSKAINFIMGIGAEAMIFLSVEV